MIMLWITTLCVSIIIMIYVYLAYRRLQWSDTKAVLQDIHDHYLQHPNLSPSTLRESFTRYTDFVRTLDEGVVYVERAKPIDFAFVYACFLHQPSVNYIVWTPRPIDMSLIRQSRDTFMTFCYNPWSEKFHTQFGIFQRSRFTMEYLFYLVHQRRPTEAWQDVMKRIGFTSHNLGLRTRTDDGHDRRRRPWYTYFFTIHFGTTCPTSTTVQGMYVLRDRWLTTDRPIVFQTWIDHAIDNEYLWKCYETTQRVYAQHPYKLFSDFEMKQFVRQNYGEEVVYQYDNIIPSAFKSDFFRYLFLYKHGGLYMDISVMPVTNMLDYFRQYYHEEPIRFISATDNGHPTRLWNGLMFAEARHPFMKYCIDQIMRLRKSSFKHCLYYTGPALLGEAVGILGKSNPDYRLVRFLDGDYITDPSTEVPLFAPKSLGGWRTHKQITRDMYQESNKAHYSMHCLYNQILYY